MIFGAFGIPLFLIGIADVGRFFKTFIMFIVQKIYRKEIKKQGERKLLREIGEASAFLSSKLFKSNQINRLQI